MADSVIILERQEVRAVRQNLRYRFRLLTLYDFTTGPGLRVRDATGAIVVVTPSSGLPASYRALLTAEEVTAVDAGHGAWELHDVEQLNGESIGQLAARVSAALPRRKLAWIAREQNRYAQFGLRVS